jgi:hypothetical protein
VVEIALDTLTLTPLAVDLGPVGGVAVDRDWVYFTQPAQGRVVRVAKDGSAARSDAPITGPCPAPLGAAAEIAATPRADRSLEQLALRLDEERVVASEETYERVLADVKAIRALAPALAGITHAPRDDGRSLLLTTTDMALQSMQANAYSAWDCLNAHYGLEAREVMRFGAGGSVMLRLKGLYNLRLLSELYSMLPGIVSAGPSSSGGGDETICARRTAEGIAYVVDRGSGDCFLGCIDHDARRFVSRASGVVESAESWNSMSGAPRPDWFTRDCTR